LKKEYSEGRNPEVSENIKMQDQVLHDAEALFRLFCETINFCGAFPKKSDPQEAHLTENKT